MRGASFLLRAVIMLAVAAAIPAFPAQALVQHPNTVAYPNSEEPPVMADKPVDAVVGRWSTNASAVAIGPNYILTTVHQGGGIGTTVNFGGNDYRVAEILQHPKADLRIARITTMDGLSPANLASTVGYYSSQNEYKKTAVIGGFGLGRGDTYPNYYTWSGSGNTTERWGQNYIELYPSSTSDPLSFSSQLITALFDNYGVDKWVSYEACVAVFDSGGGWFLREGGTGPWQVAGLSRGVTHALQSQSWFSGNQPNNTGDRMDAVRISQYAGWLDNAFSPSKWNSASGGNWSDGTKWSGPVPATQDKWALFSDTAPAARTVFLTTTPQIGTLRFDCAGDVTISPVSSNSLEFKVTNNTQDAGLLETAAANGNGALTITAPIYLSSPLVVRPNSSGTLTISGNISDPLDSKTLTKTGTGLLVLSGANTYKGGTYITQGTLRATAAGALGNTSSSYVTLVAGATLDIRSDSALTLNNTVKVAAHPTSPAITTAVFNVDRATAGPARTMTFGGTLTTDSAVTLSTTTATGCSLAFSGLATVAAGTTINTAGADFALTGGLSLAGGILTKSGAKKLSLSGTQTYGAGTTLRVNDGTLTLNSDAGSASAYNLSLATSNAATVNLGASQHLAALSLGGTSIATITPGGHKTVATTAFTIAGGTSPTATLDVNDNFLAINYTGASPFADVRAQIKSAYNAAAGGDWRGRGITSALLAGGSTANGIGYAENNTGAVSFGSGTPFGDYAGADSTTVLVRYTLIGDVNLDGIVDDSDISILSNNYGFAGINWANGDVYGYDGIVSDDDVGLQANNYGMTAGNVQSLAGSWSASDPTLLDASLGGASALTAVPEPVTALLLGAGVLALAARRRRH